MGVSLKTRRTYLILSILLGLLLLFCFLNQYLAYSSSLAHSDIACLVIGTVLISVGLTGLLAIKPCCVSSKTCCPLPSSNEELHECLKNLEELRQKLVLQEKMVQVGLLTAGIVHEIKNPLNFVRNFAGMSVELMQELNEVIKQSSAKLDQATVDDIEGILQDLTTNVQKIHEHAKRAESIVLNMLMQSRSEEAVEKNVVEINPLLEEFTNLAYHGLRAQDITFNIKIEKDLKESTGTCLCVAQSIGRVFLNIINNGMYAAFVRAQAQPEHKPVIKISSEGNENFVIIHIRDNGQGIPEHLVEQIFKPFFTTKPKGQGTGLGLSICHDIIVHDHHGEIKVESKFGEYTEFTIILPRQDIKKVNV